MIKLLLLLTFCYLATGAPWFPWGPGPEDYDGELLSLRADCTKVNHVNDRPGYYTCDCVPANDGCLSNGDCKAEANCPTKDGQAIGTATTTKPATTTKATTTAKPATTTKATTTAKPATTTAGTTSAPGNTCTTKVTFPIKAVSGISGYPWMVEVFGIPIIGTAKFKTSGKLQFAAHILAELLDNDNDGCADDSKVLANLQKKTGDGKRKTLFLINKESDTFPYQTAETAGYALRQLTYFDECLPKFAGLNAIGKRDATMEEFTHFINAQGHIPMYPKTFGSKWTSNSALTKAMDIARGGRVQTTPTSYPAAAWYKYTDTTCDYNCQAVEYLWWGYVAYSGIGNGLAGTAQFSNEFSLLNKAKFLAGDKALAKIFNDSGKTYVLPTKPVDGTYTGCNTCSSGTNHGA